MSTNPPRMQPRVVSLNHEWDSYKVDGHQSALELHQLLRDCASSVILERIEEFRSVVNVIIGRRTALMLAVEKSDEKCIRFVMEMLEPEINLVVPTVGTLLHLAVGMTNRITRIAVNDRGEAVIEQVERMSGKDVVQYLLQNGADPYLIEPDRMEHALMYVPHGDNTDGWWCLIEHPSARVIVNGVSRTAGTLLHRLVLEHQTACQRRDAYAHGMDVGWMIIDRRRSSIERMIQYAIEQLGASKDVRDVEGRTPVDTAGSTSRETRRLLDGFHNRQ